MAQQHNIPEKLYLQWYGSGIEDELGEVSEQDVTWSRDKIFEHDIAYIREDSAAHWQQGYPSNHYEGKQVLLDVEKDGKRYYLHGNIQRVEHIDGEHYIALEYADDRSWNCLLKGTEVKRYMILGHHA